METEQETMKDFLTRLSDTTESGENDSKIMENVLRRYGFPDARVVYGVVYVDGSGRPESIHNIAKQLLAIGG